jgi:glutathione S-transferase
MDASSLVGYDRTPRGPVKPAPREEPPLKLYHAQNTRSVRPRWLLEELGVPYELVHVALWSGEGETDEYLSIHPLGAVPALVDGDLRLHESGAICLYLADKYPEKGFAPPVGSHERALYYQWLLYAVGTLEGPVMDYYASFVQTPEADRVESDITSARIRFEEAAQVIEKHMQGREWLVGSSITAADIMTISIIAWARMMGLLAKFPNLEAYMKRGAARPANKKSRAD